MPRRRLQVVCSSSDEEENEVTPIQPPPHRQDIVEEIIEPDEDDDDDRIISSINFQNVTLHSSSSSNLPPRNPVITQPVPFQIPDSDSDSDLDPVADFQSVNTGSNPVNTEYADGCIGLILQRMGLKLKTEWLESCVRGLESTVPGFSGFDNSQKAKLCFEQLLYADMNYCGAGVLPPNVHRLNLVDLKGPFVLQVDEIVNLSCPLKTRYQNAAPGLKRCLKLSLTDGVQRVFAMEYRPIKDLEVLSPAGLKVVVSNVNLRRGLLLLVPEVIEVLGGKVDELDAAQQRLIQEVNKPPRGKRTRSGVVPPLSTRATSAAWPPETSNFQENRGGPTSEMMPPQVVHQAIPVRDVPRQSYTAPAHSEDGGSYRSSAVETAGVRIATEQVSVPSIEVTDSISVASAAMEVEDIDMIDDPIHPFLSTIEKEIPFTYLASLSTKWTAMKDRICKVEGKIKCFLTGVKGFQFKGRTTYELRVYVDDGSLISETLIDHNVVQKCITHSPVEVCTALASSDTKIVSDIKNNLKQFQIFLADFEGTMVVQMTADSSVPVAIEMNQGCTSSDALLLLERFRSSYCSVR